MAVSAKGIDDAFINGATFKVVEVQEEAWGDLDRVPDRRPRVPTLPEEMIPAPLRPWIVDEAQRKGLPYECLAVGAIGALATIIGRKVGIRPKRYDDWLVIPVVWGVLIAPPSRKKTAALKAGLRPIFKIDEEGLEDFKSGESMRRAKLQVNALRREELVKSSPKRSHVTDASVAALEHDLTTLLEEEAELKRSRRRIYTNDTTVEKLQGLLAANPNGMLVFRDELMGFLRTFDKQGRESDRSFYLEAWNGNGTYLTDRMERNCEVAGLCVSIIAGTQPSRFEPYIASARSGAGNDGLVQRFQLVIYPDFDSPLVEHDRTADKAAWMSALAAYRRLDALNARALGLVEEGDVPALRFDPGAQELFMQWYHELNRRLSSGELDETMEEHLGKYPSLMPTLALLFHLVNWADDRSPWGPVSLEAAELAADWCAFLEEHAKKVYHVIRNAGARAAHALATKIEQGLVADRMTLRDIYRHEWRYLSTPAEVSSAIAVLEPCQWVRVVETPSGEHGGRPSEMLRLHPELRRHGEAKS